MFTNVESTELISNVRNIMDELEKRLDPSYVAEQEKAEVDGQNVIQHKGLKLKKVEREAREGDYAVFNGVNDITTLNGKPYLVFVVKSEPQYEGETGGNLDVYGWNVTCPKPAIYEPIGHCKPVEYEPPFPEVLTPNEQRALLIKQAKEFVDGHTQKTITSTMKRGIGFRCWVVEERFVSNANKRTVVCLLKGVNSSRVHSKGIAKCAPNDVFNEHIGQAIALARALEIEVPEGFLKAVQPDEVVVGHITRGNNTGRIYTISSIVGDKLFAKEHVGEEYTRTNDITIIDDTNAEYNNA